MQAPRHARSSTRFWLIALTLCAVTALVFPALSQAKKPAHKHKHGGWAYTETNEPDNKVVVYRRGADGSLTEIERVDTGGAGVNGNPPFGQGFLDSNGAVELTKNGRLLFVVNAGDDTISSFRVKRNGRLRLADTAPSGGDHPTSIDTHKGLLYVLNVDSNDISGLRYNKKGNLRPLSNSTRQLATPLGTTPEGLPSPFADQVLFSPNGKVLTVPERLSNGYMGQLDTFRIRRSGRPGQAQANASNGFIPFGLEWDNHGHLIVANGGPPPNFSPGTGSSYSLSGTTLTPIDNQLAGDDATCWLAITNNGKYVFMINQPPGRNGSVSRFSISRDGHLTLLGTTPTSGASADTALSRDSKYLFVQNIILPGQTGNATIDTYRVHSDGSLTHLGLVDSGVPGSASGFAAR
jgi:6-phosphogluconolactonase